MFKNEKDKIILIILALLLGISIFFIGYLTRRAGNQSIDIKTLREKITKVNQKSPTIKKRCFEITNKTAKKVCDKTLNLSLNLCYKNIDDLLCRKFLWTKMISEIIRNQKATSLSKNICQFLFTHPGNDNNLPKMEPKNFCSQITEIILKQEKKKCGQSTMCKVLADPQMTTCVGIKNSAYQSNCLGRVYLIKSLKENNSNECNNIANIEYRSLCFKIHSKLTPQKCADLFSGENNFYKINADTIYCK